MELLVPLVFYLGFGGVLFLGLKRLLERYRGAAMKIAAAAAFCTYVTMAFLVGAFGGSIDKYASFGGSNRALVDACVSTLEAGQADRALASLRQLQQDYRPTYENDAHWHQLVRRAVEVMKAEAKDDVPAAH